jgi:hypothetical protein
MPPDRCIVWQAGHCGAGMNPDSSIVLIASRPADA